MRRFEVHAEDFGVLLVLLSLVLVIVAADQISRIIGGLLMLLAGLVIGVGLYNPHQVIDLSLLRKKSHKE